MGSVEIN